MAKGRHSAPRKGFGAAKKPAPRAVAVETEVVKESRPAKVSTGAGMGIGKKIGIVACVFVVVLIALGGAAFAAANRYLNTNLNRIDVENTHQMTLEEAEALKEQLRDTEPVEETNEEPEDGEADPEATKTPAPTPTPVMDWSGVEALNDDALINVILVGVDNYDEGVKHTDSMILLSINPELQKASVISFMRDTYVNIPGYFPHRLNVPYMLGGYPVLSDTLRDNFGINLDGYCEVDFGAFEAVVNAIGGVEIELSEGESSLLIGTHPGWNHLNGYQTRVFCQIRSIDSDYMRTNRQRIALGAILDSVRDLKLVEVMDLADEIIPYVSTSFSNTEIFTMITNCFPMLKSLELKSYRIPADEDHYMDIIDGNSVLVTNYAAVRQHLETTYLPLN